MAAGDSDNSNFRTRYRTTSTTPITDIDYLNGVTSNVQDQLDAKTSTSLADTKAWVGNSAGAAVAQNITIINDVTATMSNTGVMNATIPASTITSEMIAIANVTATDLFLNTVTATVDDSETGTEVTVESGSILIDTQKVSGFSNDVTLTKSIIVGTTWIINTDAGGGQVINGLMARPAP
jgi:hypothetical protein